MRNGITFFLIQKRVMRNGIGIFLNWEIVMQNVLTFYLNRKMVMQNGILGISVEAYCIRPIKASSKETYDQKSMYMWGVCNTPIPWRQKGSIPKINFLVMWNSITFFLIWKMFMRNQLSFYMNRKIDMRNSTTIFLIRKIVVQNWLSLYLNR